MCTLRQGIASRSEGRHFWCPPGPNLNSSGADAQEGAAVDRQLGALEDIRVRVGTLLKTETVSLLLGAGASVDCGGQLIGSVPLSIERHLNDEGVDGEQAPQIQPWLTAFYLAVRLSGRDGSTPVTCEEILARRVALIGGSAAPASSQLRACAGNATPLALGVARGRRSAASGRHAVSGYHRGRSRCVSQPCNARPGTRLPSSNH